MASAVQDGTSLLTSTVQSEAPSLCTEEMQNCSLGMLPHSGTGLERWRKGEQQDRPMILVESPAVAGG
jgi:hypothetical protein